MTEPYTGQIQIFGFNFAPYRWAMCMGQIMPIQQNTALFALLGTQYGGDGRVTYGLPNFSGSVGCNQGSGPGLSDRVVGEQFGSTSVTLLQTEMPAHTHTVNIWTPDPGTVAPPGALGLVTANFGFVPPPATTPFSPMMVAPDGGSQAHNNMQPFVSLNYSIALYGIFPSFN